MAIRQVCKNNVRGDIMSNIRVYSNHYNINGKKYDRITEVLDYFMPKYLVKWALNKGKANYKAETNLAKKIGKRVDGICMDIINGKKWKITDKDHPAVSNCVEAFQDWLNEEKPVIVDTQVTCYDDTLKIAGTRDLRTADTIIDIKCANRISLSYWLQLSAYNYLAKLPDITHIAVLRLDKMGGFYEYKRIPVNDQLWQLYKTLLGYYRYNTMYDKIDKGGDKKIEKVNTEFQKKFGVFSGKVKTDWSEFHKEI
jgi:hypothetical protein